MHTCNGLFTFVYWRILCVLETNRRLLKHACSGELKVKKEVIPVAVKVIKDCTEPDMVQREMDALAAVRGLPHFVQEVDSKYHVHADDSSPPLIVTRYTRLAHQGTLQPEHVQNAELCCSCSKLCQQSL